MDKIKQILNSDTATVRVYLVKKSRKGVENYSCVIFPNNLNQSIKNVYKENFSVFTKDKTITDYDSIHTEKGSIQKAPLSDIDEWSNIKTAIKIADDKNIFMNKENFSDDYSVIIVSFEDEINNLIQQVNLVAQYRKLESWYKKSVKFGFTTNGLKEKDSEIFVLNGCIDTVIFNDHAYILQENQFERIFNYHKKSVRTLETNKENIEKCSFIDDPVAFYESVRKNNNATKKMARVISKQTLDLSTLPPKDIKVSLSKYEEFSKLKFDENDKIILDKSSRDMVIDILRCVYSRSLFSDKVVHTKGV